MMTQRDATELSCCGIGGGSGGAGGEGGGAEHTVSIDGLLTILPAEWLPHTSLRLFQHSAGVY